MRILCVHVHLCVHPHICVHVCIGMLAYASMNMYVCVHTPICTPVCRYACLYGHGWKLEVGVRMSSSIASLWVFSSVFSIYLLILYVSCMLWAHSLHNACVTMGITCGYSLTFHCLSLKPFLLRLLVNPTTLVVETWSLTELITGYFS